jgi:dipeptidyl aminopeptidase/acylaminoacyl peptidase
LQAEAAAMFEALKAQGRQGSVQWVLYPDEGHSITRLANRLDFHSRAEQLLAESLGGRREPPLQPRRSSAQVKS